MLLNQRAHIRQLHLASIGICTHVYMAMSVCVHTHADTQLKNLYVDRS